MRRRPAALLQRALWTIAAVLSVLLLLVVLDRADLLTTGYAQGTSSMAPNEYFVLGDRRSSQDSRDFGPVPRKAIFARVVLIFWPLGRFGVPGYDQTSVPPGPLCSHY